MNDSAQYIVTNFNLALNGNLYDRITYYTIRSKQGIIINYTSYVGKPSADEEAELKRIIDSIDYKKTSDYRKFISRGSGWADESNVFYKALVKSLSVGLLVLLFAIPKMLLKRKTKDNNTNSSIRKNASVISSDPDIADEEDQASALSETDNDEDEMGQPLYENTFEESTVCKIAPRYCKYCGAVIDSDSIFCSKCGKKII